MEVIVNFHPSVLEYFNKLIDTLFLENYFLYKESAIEYVIKLISLVENQVDKKKHHVAPESISIYGNYFIGFNINSKTTWYFIFEVMDNRYLITYVFNNYSKEAKYLF